MRVAIITDTHFSFKKSNPIYHNYFERFYCDVFFPTLEDRRIDSVIHMGDAFDNRKGIDYWSLEWAYRVFYDRLRDNRITLYQLCGNHDAEKRNTNKYNSIDTLLRDYDNVIRITEVDEYKIGGLKCIFVPWICKDNQEETFKKIEESNSKVLFGHLELNGFTLFPGQIQKGGMSKDILKKFDRVLSGHYHTQSNDGKIFYIGNPYQMFWSDVNDSRGFVIFDTETYEMEHIQNPYEIFSRVYFTDRLNPKEFDYTQFEDKNVKVIIQEKSNQSDYDYFIDKILTQNIIDLKIVDTIDVNDDLVNASELNCEDTLSVLNKYIELSDFKLNKESIKNILYDTYREALEMEV